jgi:hypothetical protein
MQHEAEFRARLRALLSSAFELVLADAEFARNLVKPSLLIERCYTVAAPSTSDGWHPFIAARCMGWRRIGLVSP